MKFIVSSSALLKQLQQISGVINANTVLPILEDFLFAELSEVQIGTSHHNYSKLLNRIEGQLSTIFNDFFPALVILFTESLFLMFTLTFFILNYFCVIYFSHSFKFPLNYQR